MTVVTAKQKSNPLTGAIEFLASYRLAALVFVLLLVLVYLGTLDQIENGLYAAQQKYFNSLFLVHIFFGAIPMVLPGGYFLLIVLTVNLICGGILRMRKGWSQAGVLLMHGGILVLMAGAFITFKYSYDGHMTLYEDQRSNEFQSYHDWEVTATETGTEGEARQFVIDGDALYGLTDGSSKTFSQDALPFDLTLYGYEPNTVRTPKGPMFETDAKIVDGTFLQPLERDKQNERNVAGIYGTITDSETGSSRDGILWGMDQSPWVVTSGGQTWLLEMRRKRWQVPFTVVLDKFTRELHPGTNTPRVFMSNITKIEGNDEQKIRIEMNEPLRHEGYTFFQASWGPQDAGPNEPLFSTFAVVRNPADQFPLYACIIITAGLTLHFSIKLRKYLRAEARRRPA
jgi:hypothetical protein